MKVEYDGLEMDLVEIVNYTREGVYSPDKVDLLYVMHRISMVVVLAPGGYPRAVSLIRDPNAQAGSTTARQTFPGADARATKRGVNAVPPPAADAFTDPDTPPGTGNQYQPGAILTDHEVRARLMMPRKRFKITAYEESSQAERVWIEAPGITGLAPSPSGSYESLGLSDPANGPTPLRVDSVQMTGEGTSESVFFSIEFAVVPVAPESERLVLSHRWETQYASDESRLLSRVTTGLLVFHGGLLGAYATGVAGFARESPDVYRNQFFHPIPVGFVRSLPDVTISSDGLNLRYTILDQQPGAVFDPGDSGAVHMELVENMNYLSPNGIDVAERTITTLGGLLG
jgi:hypothetical protein